MAISRSGFLIPCIGFWALLAQAKTLTFDFNITWVTANPDGGYDRPTIGINNQWPIPAIRCTKGDQIIVNVNNQLGNESTSLHFHGLYMNGTTEMDGPAGVSQCSIPPGSSMTYNFTADQVGNYWYHSHDHGQYPDGLRGPFIIEDPDSPYKGKYDADFVLTLSDWYHDSMHNLMKSFINFANPTGAEPVPNAALMNDTQNLTVSVEPGKTYLFRIVNMAAFAAQYLWFEGHTMRIVEVDGITTEEAETDMIYITAAQRYGVLVTMKNDTSSNFPIVGHMDEDLFDTVPDGLNSNVTGWLVYDQAKTLPDPQALDDLSPYDDFALVPTDGLEIYDKVDHSITLVVAMDNLGDGANYAFFNDITYVRQKVPTLYTALTAPQSLVTDPTIYGLNTNSFVLEHNEVVEIVINNNDPGKHPFHLHGHNFQLVVRSAEEAGDYDPNNSTALYDEAPVKAYPKVPMRRDTALVRPNGNMVLRFKSDNPGVWLFHCHIEWHVDSGLVATMVEAPLELRAQKGIGNESDSTAFMNWLPQSHRDSCEATNQSFEGNAGANTVDFTDLSNANLPPNPLPAGFTARGIVALVFSCVAAFLGLAVISWYGVGEIKNPAAK